MGLFCDIVTIIMVVNLAIVIIAIAVGIMRSLNNNDELPL
jgi:hypothetical protein